MADKRKMTVVFLIAVLLFTIIVLLPDKQIEVEYSKPETTSESVEYSFEFPSVSEKDASKAEKVTDETTFWIWEGKETGTDSIEYMTLRGDGIYILRIELAGREPVEEQGYFKYGNTEKNIVTIPYKGDCIKAEINGSELTVENKTFTRLSESHF